MHRTSGKEGNTMKKINCVLCGDGNIVLSKAVQDPEKNQHGRFIDLCGSCSNRKDLSESLRIKYFPTDNEKAMIEAQEKAAWDNDRQEINEN